MKRISLTQGQFALVDDADFEWANQWKWHATRGKSGKFYAGRNAEGGTLLLHRELLEAPVGIEVDHRNRLGLDCQRKNLRFATSQQNSQNIGKTKSKTSSQFKGVCKCNRHKNPWQSYIGGPGGPIKRRHLGIFASEKAAARAYDTAAKKLFGDFAYLNFPNE